MVEDSNKLLGIMLVAFVTVLVGLAFFESTSNSIEGVVTSSSVDNESVTLTNGTAVNLANKWVTSVTSVLAEVDNATNSTLTVNVNYTTSQLNDHGNYGQITLIDANYDGNESFVSYNFNPQDYVDEGSTRALLRTIKIFFAIGVLAVGLGLGFFGLKKSGMI